MTNAIFEKIENELLCLLEKAEHSIYVAVYMFTNPRLIKMLIRRAIEGFDVRLIIHDDPVNNARSDLFQAFIRAGGILRLSRDIRPMHNKFCILDTKVLVTGSYNWTYNAEKKNFENIIVLENEGVIDDYIKEFIRLESELDEVTNYNDLMYEKTNSSSHDLLEKFLLFEKDNSEKELVEDIAFNELLKATYELITPDFTGRKISASIGVGLRSGLFMPIVQVGSEIPVILKTESIQTAYNEQESLTAIVYYGNNEIAKDNKKIGELNIFNLPKLNAGEIKFNVNIKINKRGCLDAWLTQTNHGNKVSMVLTKNISNVMTL